MLEVMGIVVVLAVAVMILFLRWHRTTRSVEEGCPTCVGCPGGRGNRSGPCGGAAASKRHEDEGASPHE